MKRLMFYVAVAQLGKLILCDELQPLNVITDEYVKSKIGGERLALNEMDIQVLQPGCFRSAALVEIINLSSNKIQEINEHVFNNLRARVLDLSSNAIASIAKKSFDDMPKLAWISLFNNSLKLIEIDWFKNCPNLKFISLMSNNIEEIPNRAFGNLAKNIDAILLRNNQIRKIHAGAFRNVEEFGMIDLWNNQLEDLPADLFPNLKKGIVVDFGANKLKCAPSTKYFEKITAVGLLKNNLECECVRSLKEFSKMVQSVYVQFDDQC